jgi:hypothetical protein
MEQACRKMMLRPMAGVAAVADAAFGGPAGVPRRGALVGEPALEVDEAAVAHRILQQQQHKTLSRSPSNV